MYSANDDRDTIEALGSEMINKGQKGIFEMATETKLKEYLKETQQQISKLGSMSRPPWANDLFKALKKIRVYLVDLLTGKTNPPVTATT